MAAWAALYAASSVSVDRQKSASLTSPAGHEASDATAKPLLFRSDEGGVDVGGRDAEDAEGVVALRGQRVQDRVLLGLVPLARLVERRSAEAQGALQEGSLGVPGLEVGVRAAGDERQHDGRAVCQLDHAACGGRGRSRCRCLGCGFGSRSRRCCRCCRGGLGRVALGTAASRSEQRERRHTRDASDPSGPRCLRPHHCCLQISYRVFPIADRVCASRYCQHLYGISLPFRFIETRGELTVTASNDTAPAGPDIGQVERLPQRQALADDVYEAINALLMDSIIAPDARITIDTLARQLGVSPTPVREALARLESDGLVVKQGLRGYFATPAAEPRRDEGHVSTSPPHRAVGGRHVPPRRPTPRGGSASARSCAHCPSRPGSPTMPTSRPCPTTMRGSTTSSSNWLATSSSGRASSAVTVTCTSSACSTGSRRRRWPPVRRSRSTR